jgi:hypothetical protein
MRRFDPGPRLQNYSNNLAAPHTAGFRQLLLKSNGWGILGLFGADFLSVGLIRLRSLIAGPAMAIKVSTIA